MFKRTITNVINNLNKHNVAMTADDAHAYVQQVIETATTEFIDLYIKTACEKCKFSVEVPLEDKDNVDLINKRHEIEIRLTAYGDSLDESVLNNPENPVTKVSWNVVEEKKTNEPKPRGIGGEDISVQDVNNKLINLLKYIVSEKTGRFIDLIDKFGKEDVETFKVTGFLKTGYNNNKEKTWSVTRIAEDFIGEVE